MLETIRRRGMLLAAVGVLIGGPLAGADWPQWRGPDRTNVATETALLDAWPEGGPEKLWSVSGVGEGYAAVAVVGGTAYTTGRIGEEGLVTAVRDGKIVGRLSYGPEISKRRGYPSSRSTPTLSGTRIYVMSALGVVSCLDRSLDRAVWQVDIFKRFGGRQLGWSLAESVLVHEGKVICTPGGSGAVMAALDADTGRTVWVTRGLDTKSAYSSATVVNHGGRDLILTMVETGVIGVDARTGELLWHHAHKNKHAVHPNTPIYVEGHVFVSSGYGYGSELLKLARDGNSVTPVYRTEALDNHHGGVVRIGESIYGTNDRGMVCLDLWTGKVNWQDRAVGKGSLTVADGDIIAYGERGQVGLIRPDPQQCRLISSFAVEEGEGQHWAHPVVSDGRLYIRHGDVLMAFDVSTD